MYSGYIDVGSQQLRHQREISAYSTKKEVCELKMEKQVILPTDSTSFKDWWEQLDDGNQVEVCYPREAHGLNGKKSNRAKMEVMESF